MADSFVHHGINSTSFVGPDATALFAAIALRRALEFYAKTGMKVNRAYTPTAMLAAASRYSGKAYKRGRLAEASADLTVWIEAMRAAIPVSSDRPEGVA